MKIKPKEIRQYIKKALSRHIGKLFYFLKKVFSFLKRISLFIGLFLWNRLKSYWRPFCIFLLFLIICWGIIVLFGIINKVPNRRIEMEIDREGDSELSSCKVSINANFEKKISKEKLFNSKSNLQEICNVVYINHCNASNGIPLYKRERGGILLVGYPNHIDNYEILRKKFPSHYKSLYTAYSVRYKVGVRDSTIKAEKEKIDSANCTCNYTSEACCYEDDEGLYVKGTHIVAFNNCSGADTLYFANQNNNSRQNFLCPWDISQSNYKIRINTTRIHCEKLIIDFHQSVKFSMMYPIPDKMTARSIEYSSPNSINELGDIGGLFFHVEFVETKTMQDVRNFILTVIMSIIVAFFSSYVIKNIEKKYG